MRQRTEKAGDGLTTTECECGWSSRGWATKKEAERRGAAHSDEHETNVPAPELVDFREGE